MTLDYRIKGRSPIIRPRSAGGVGVSHGALISRYDLSSPSVASGSYYYPDCTVTHYDTDNFVATGTENFSGKKVLKVPAGMAGKYDIWAQSFLVGSASFPVNIELLVDVDGTTTYAQQVTAMNGNVASQVAAAFAGWSPIQDHVATTIALEEGEAIGVRLIHAAGTSKLLYGIYFGWTYLGSW